MEHNDIVILELDRPYTLRFGNLALKEYSALTGTSMKDFDDSLMDFGKQQAAAYILVKQDCIRQGLPVPTPAAVEKMLDEYVKPGRLFYLLNKAAEAAFVDEELQEELKKKQGEDPTEAAGTGEQG